MEEKAKKTKKSEVLASVAAAVLALSMLLGAGTYAYLYDSTDDVTNTFNTNQVTVDLEESGDGNYNIIPGTSETKDPTVTVNNSVDAYVFVQVTDTTEGLVEYTIADGWTLLDGYDNVYYREVAASNEEQSFSVLAGDTVYYSAALENSDMLDEDGNLKEGLELTFKAYAIQKDGFADAVEAWMNIAIVNNEAVTLTQDISVDAAALSGVGNANIDLADHTLTITGSTYVQVGDGEEFSVSNGTVIFANDNTSYVSVSAGEGSTISFEDVDVNMNGKSILVGSSTETATVNVIDSTVYTSDYYCISTNASDNTTGQGVEINVIGSALEAEDPSGDCTAILMNVPGTLTIEDSEITAGRQAVIVRTGTAYISNSKLISTLEADESLWDKYDDATWGSGNEVPVAVLVAGNRSSSAAYPWDTTVTLDNVTLQYDWETDRALVYAAAYNGHTTVVNGISESDVTVSVGENSTVTVNP